MADFDGWDADGEGQGHGSVAAGGPGGGVVNGGLLDLRTFPGAAGAPATPDDEWIERPAPTIEPTLDTDVHAEVLRDILNAQAKLPSIGSSGNNTITFNGKPYSVLAARTFDPARSYGATAMPTSDMVAAGIAGAPSVAMPYGRAEKLAFMIPFPIPPTSADVDATTGLARTLPMKPTVFISSSGGATTGSKNGADTAEMKPPFNALAGIHGHIDQHPDGSELASYGMVDKADADGGYGDANSLRFNLPMATVSHGQVGWHGIDNGQLKFIYPKGAMTPDQIWQMQQNLDDEQQKFLRPK